MRKEPERTDPAQGGRNRQLIPPGQPRQGRRTKRATTAAAKKPGEPPERSTKSRVGPLPCHKTGSPGPDSPASTPPNGSQTPRASPPDGSPRHRKRGATPGATAGAQKTAPPSQSGKSLTRPPGHKTTAKPKPANRPGRGKEPNQSKVSATSPRGERGGRKLNLASSTLTDNPPQREHSRNSGRHGL